MKEYFGAYETFQVPSKKDAAMLLGADNLVGDVYQIECTLEGEIHKAWLISRFDQRIGYFDEAFSRKLSVMSAAGMTLRAILAFVAFTDHPDEGHYWGEMAVICYAPEYADVFERFIKTISGRIADGVRTRIDFDDEGVRHIIDSNGEWVPQQTVPKPEKAKGTAILKDRRKLSESLIEQARGGNKGCYLVAWLFLLALVAAVIFLLKSCFFS